MQSEKFTVGDVEETSSADDASEHNPSWKKEKKKMPLSDLFRKYGLFIAAIGLGAVILALVILIPDDARSKNENLIKTLNGKLNMMEARLNSLEKSVEEKGLGGGGEKADALREKIESLEASLNLKLSDAMKKIDEMEKRSVSDSRRTASDSDHKPASADAKLSGGTDKKPVKADETAAKATEPEKKKPAQEAKKPEPKKEIEKTGQHTVGKSETLFSISRKYGVKLDDLCRANNLKPSSRIHPGQKLKLPH